MRPEILSSRNAVIFSTQIRNFCCFENRQEKFRFHSTKMSRISFVLFVSHPDCRLYVHANRHCHEHFPSTHRNRHRPMHILNRLNENSLILESMKNARKVHRKLPKPCFTPDITHVADDSNIPCNRNTAGLPARFGLFGEPFMRCNPKI